MNWKETSSRRQRTKKIVKPKKKEQNLPHSLNAFIQQKQTELHKKVANIDKVKKHCEKLENEVCKLTERWQIHRKTELETEIEKTKKEIEKIESGFYEKEFQRKVEPYLQEQERLRIFHDMEDSCRNMGNIRKSIRHNHVKQVYYDFLRLNPTGAPPIQVTDQEKCKDCDEDMILDTHQAMLYCPVCHNTIKYIDATSTNTAYGEEVEFPTFSYDRLNHLNEWLLIIQGKESTVPEEIIEEIMEQLRRLNRVNNDDITIKLIRETLKKNQMKKYYRNVVQIWSRITGKDPPRMTMEQEHRIRMMFNQIQEPFERHKPPERKNFLSYEYVIYKCCEILEYNNFLPYFKLLKGTDKLRKQDLIWENICIDLGWPYKSTIR